MSSSQSSDRAILAYILPFLAFAALALLMEVQRFAGFNAPWWISSPEFWVYPLQTIVCGWLLWKFRHQVEWSRPRAPGVAVLVGILVLAIWISPQWLFQAPPRLDGFNPDEAESIPGGWFATVAARFVRLVVVVPLFEELFWRGFLLRYLMNENFQRIPLGQASRFSFLAVAVLFMLAHSPADYAAAFITGLLYNGLMVWKKNLADCVIAHAVTNLLLGIYILQTKQWGFW